MLTRNLAGDIPQLLLRDEYDAARDRLRIYQDIYGSENVFLEVLWTVIPFVILIAMAVPATRVLIELDDSSKAELAKLRSEVSEMKQKFVVIAGLILVPCQVGLFNL